MKVGDIVYCYRYDEDGKYHIFGKNKVMQIDDEENVMRISRCDNPSHSCVIRKDEAFNTYTECETFLQDVWYETINKLFDLKNSIPIEGQENIEIRKMLVRVIKNFKFEVC